MSSGDWNVSVGSEREAEVVRESVAWGLAVQVGARARQPEVVREALRQVVSTTPSAVPLLLDMRRRVLRAARDSSSPGAAGPAPLPAALRAQAEDPTGGVLAGAGLGPWGSGGGERREWVGKGARELDAVLEDVLGGLVGRGSLNLVQVSWESAPGRLLERIAQAETVHPTDRLWRFRSRLTDPGRQVWCLVHPTAPLEPLAFVHVALAPAMAPTMGFLNRHAQAPPPPPRRLGGAEPLWANFWSVGTTDPALKGLNTGRWLIHSVIAQFQGQVDGFCTLSPIPQFASWLRQHLQDPNTAVTPSTTTTTTTTTAPALLLARLTEWQRQALRAASSDNGSGDGGNGGGEASAKSTNEASATPNRQELEANDALQRQVLQFAAQYLVRQRGTSGRPLCSVANFHAANGAVLGRLNWGANLATHGIAQSASVMANYLYDVPRMAERAERFANVSGEDLPHEPAVHDLLLP
jgi:hypothetical protein